MPGNEPCKGPDTIHMLCRLGAPPLLACLPVNACLCAIAWMGTAVIKPVCRPLHGWDMTSRCEQQPPAPLVWLAALPTLSHRS